MGLCFELSFETLERLMWCECHVLLQSRFSCKQPQNSCSLQSTWASSLTNGYHLSIWLFIFGQFNNHFYKIIQLFFYCQYRIGSKVSIELCLLKRVLIFLRVLSSKWHFLHYIWSEVPSAYLCIYVCIPNAQSLVFCILLLLFKSRKTPLRFSTMIRSEMAIRLLLIG